MTPVRRPAAVLASLVLVAVLGGCRDDDGEAINPRSADASPASAESPAPAPSPSPSPTPSATPTPS